MAPSKDRILAEIRRLAVASGGVAPGTKLFARETGIKESDWRGRYWPNWGQALREAGYSPNAWVTAAPEDELMARLADYVRSQGRYPVDAELQIARRKDPTVPATKVLRDRFGSSRATVDALLRYARKQNDVALTTICEERLARAAPRPTRASGGLSTAGSVYLMKSGQFFKIGMTNATGRREYELAIQLPEKLKVVHEIKTDCPAALEAYWHARFATKRCNGEWFELATSDIKSFTRRRQFLFTEIFP